MHVKAGTDMLSVRGERKRKEKKGMAEEEFGRIDCVMVARCSADAIRISACARRKSARRSVDDYLFAGAPNADDSFVKARGIATQRTATLLAIRRRRR